MKKLLFLTLFCLAPLISQAKTIEATYKISYGILGKLGLAKTTLVLNDNNTYSIKVHAYATGLAKVLSGNKEETYESHGVIKDGNLLPHSFTKYSQNKYKKRLKKIPF